jgi:predicted CopG family antitoxin
VEKPSRTILYRVAGSRSGKEYNYAYTYVYYMTTRTISISEEAYQTLKSLKESGRMSFSEVIVKYYPRRRALSEVLEAISPNEDLAASIESASEEMRSRKARKAEI